MISLCSESPIWLAHFLHDTAYTLHIQYIFEGRNTKFWLGHLLTVISHYQPWWIFSQKWNCRKINSKYLQNVFYRNNTNFKLLNTHHSPSRKFYQNVKIWGYHDWAIIYLHILLILPNNPQYWIKQKKNWRKVPSSKILSWVTSKSFCFGGW